MPLITSRWTLTYHRVGGTLSAKQRFIWVTTKVVEAEGRDRGDIAHMLVSALAGDGKARVDWKLDPTYTGDHAAEFKANVEQHLAPAPVDETFQIQAADALKFIEEFPDAPYAKWAAKMLGVSASGGWAAPQ